MGNCRRNQEGKAMTRVLQTRQVGLTTHASGHVMAPPDIVYEVEEEPKPAPWAPFMAGIAVRVLFVAAPFVAVIALAVRAGWLPT